MVPKGFQVARGIGFIPEDWQLKNANLLCGKITKGTTPPKSEIVDDSNIPFLRVNNLSFNGALDRDTNLLFVSQKSHEGFLARSRVYPGDILMNIVGPPLGKTAILDDSYHEYNMNQAIVVFRILLDRMDRNYFLFYLNSSLAQQWFQSRSKKTSGQQNLTIELCKDLPVPQPLLSEQIKISQILSTWDKVIILTKQLLANSQQQKKSMMQQLLTGKKRFPEFGEEWSEISLSNLCVIKTGKKDVNEGNPKGQYLFFTCAKEPTYSDDYSFDCEALLIAGNGALGTTHYCNGKFEAYQWTYVLNEFGNNIVVSYLHQFILYSLARNIEREKQHGAMPYIKLGLLQNFKVSVPSLEEQQKIGSVLLTADREIGVQQKKLNFLKQEKKALMQQLLTGKRRVKVD